MQPKLCAANPHWSSTASMHLLGKAHVSSAHPALLVHITPPPQSVLSQAEAITQHRRPRATLVCLDHKQITPSLQTAAASRG